jgi:hypothetical protein
MTGLANPSVHASAVLVGIEAVLIRGPSGAGKSRLAFDLILAGLARQIPATLLIGDDRVDLSEQNGRLIVRPVAALAGLIEIRGLGIRRCNYAASAPVGMVVDLAATDAERLPAAAAMRIQIGRAVVSRVPVAAGFDALPLVLGALTTVSVDGKMLGTGDCSQDIGNHMWSTLATL